MFHVHVAGVAYIGIHQLRKTYWIEQVYPIAQWCAPRGTLQEELNNVIADEIQKATGTKNLGVYVQQHTVVVKTEALWQPVV